MSNERARISWQSSHLIIGYSFWIIAGGQLHYSIDILPHK